MNANNTKEDDVLYLEAFRVPPLLDFGIPRLGDCVTRSLKLVNPHKSKVANIEVTDFEKKSVFHCEQITWSLKPKEGRSLDVMCTPNEIGHFRYSITFRFNRIFEVKVYGTGTCIRAADKERIVKHQLKEMRSIRRQADNFVELRTPVLDTRTRVIADSYSSDDDRCCTPVFDRSPFLQHAEEQEPVDATPICAASTPAPCDPLLIDELNVDRNKLDLISHRVNDEAIQQRALMTWANNKIHCLNESDRRLEPQALLECVKAYVHLGLAEYTTFVDRIASDDVPLKCKGELRFSRMAAVTKNIADLLMNYKSQWTLVALVVLSGYPKFIRLENDRSVRTALLDLLTRSPRGYDFSIPYAVTFALGFIHLLDAFSTSQESQKVQFKLALFRNDSNVKTSKLVANALAKEVFEPDIHWTRKLADCGMSIRFEQNPLNEYNYRVTEFSEDFKDGIRIGKVVAILTDCSAMDLSSCLRCPATTLTHKVHNLDWSLNHLRRECNFFTSVSSKDIALGNEEKTSAFLWSLVFAVELPKIISLQDICEHICFLRQYRRTCLDEKPSQTIRDFDIDDSTAAIIRTSSSPVPVRLIVSLLFKWIHEVNAFFNLNVRNSTTSFSDGRALCHLVNFYCPDIVNVRAVKCQTTYSLDSDPLVSIQQRLENEYSNCALFTNALSNLERLPTFTLRSKLSPNRIDQRCVLMLLAYLYTRLRKRSPRIHAARCIWMYWAKYRMVVRERRKELMARTARAIAGCVREQQLSDNEVAKAVRFARPLCVIASCPRRENDQLQRHCRTLKLLFGAKVSEDVNLVHCRTLTLTSAVREARKPSKLINERAHSCLLLLKHLVEDKIRHEVSAAAQIVLALRSVKVRLSTLKSIHICTIIRPVVSESLASKRLNRSIRQLDALMSSLKSSRCLQRCYAATRNVEVCERTYRAERSTLAHGQAAKCVRGFVDSALQLSRLEHSSKACIPLTLAFKDWVCAERMRSARKHATDLLCDLRSRQSAGKLIDALTAARCLVQLAHCNRVQKTRTAEIRSLIVQQRIRKLCLAQALIRGYLVRKHLASRDGKRQRSACRVHKAPPFALADLDVSTRALSLRSRYNNAIKVLEHSANLNQIYQTIIELDRVTSLSRECCVSLSESGGISVILRILENTNRSLEHVTLIESALAVMKNAMFTFDKSAFDCSRCAGDSRNGGVVDVLATLLLKHFKNCKVFILCAFVLGYFLKNSPLERVRILGNEFFTNRLAQIRSDCARYHAEKRFYQGCLIKVGPDWNLRPATRFSNQYEAMMFLDRQLSKPIPPSLLRDTSGD